MVALYPILYYFSKDVNVNDLFIVIDNVDSYPSIYQNRLIQAIRTVTESSNWQGPKIVLSMRLSTYRRHIGQFRAPEAVDHESPDPVEIIFLLLNHFLLHPNTFQSLKKTTRDVENAILLRVGALWHHLVDSDGYFDTMLSSIAGTNVRNAKKITANWLQSEYFRLGRWGSNLYDECGEEFERVIVEAVLRELWSSILKGIYWTVLNHTKESLTISSNTIGKQSGYDFLTIVAEILRDSRLLCYPDYGDEKGIRYLLAKKIKSRVKSVFTQQIEDCERVKNLLNKHATDIVCILKEHLKQKDIRPFIEGFIGVVCKSKIEESLFDACASMNNDYNHLLGELFAEWLDIVFDNILSCKLGDQNLTAYIPKRPVIGYLAPYSSCTQKYLPYISRFDAGWQLLQPKGIKPEERIEAINVFGSPNDINIIPLLVLYTLYYQKNNEMDTAKLKDRILKFYELDEKLFYSAMSNMVHIDKRLLFSTVSDYFYGVKRIFDSENPVILSSAGKGYVENLIVSPPYLQWAFSSEKELQRNKSVYKQVSKVKSMLSRIVEHEKTYIEIRFKAYQDGFSQHGARITMSRIGPKYYCASLDLYFRSMSYYIPALISHAKKRKGQRLTTLEHIRQWINDGKQNMFDICDMFGVDFKDSDLMTSKSSVVNRWQEEILHAEKALLKASSS